MSNDLYSIRLKASLWSSAAAERTAQLRVAAPPKVSTHHSALTPELATRLTALFVKLISAARKLNQDGLDGVTYRFRGAGSACGKVWTPGPESQGGRLVGLIDLLSKHAETTGPKALAKSEKSIARALDAMDDAPSEP